MLQPSAGRAGNTQGNGPELTQGSAQAQVAAAMLRVCLGQAGASHSSPP